MTFYFTLENNLIKSLESLKIGDKILCEDGKFYPIKSIMIISCYPIFYRLSNGFNFYASPRMVFKTTEGFKNLELWDVIKIDKNLTPQVVNIKNIDRIMFFRDILIDGNMVTTEGIVFKYMN